MCGADNNYLALTWRQIDTIQKTALDPPRRPSRPRRRASAQRPDATQSVGADPLRGQGQSDLFAADHLGRELLSGARGGFPRRLAADVQGRRAARARQSRCARSIKDMRRQVGASTQRQAAAARLARTPSAARGRRDRRQEKSLPMMTPIKDRPRRIRMAMVDLTTNMNPYGLAAVEWSNALARVLPMRRQEGALRFQRREISWDQQPRLRGYVEDRRKNYVSFNSGSAAVLQGRYRSHFRCAGAGRRTDARPLFAVAKRLSRMLLLLLGFGAARLCQHHDDRSGIRAPATTGCSASAPVPISPMTMAIRD